MSFFGKLFAAKPPPPATRTYVRQDMTDLSRLIASRLRTRNNHYDAAYTNRLRDDWPTTSSVPYTDIKQSLPTIIARSRREIDNNGIAAGIRRTIVNNVWGEGPIVQAQVKFDNGSLQKTVNDELEAAWERFSEEIDATGETNFSLFGKGILETIISSGTCLLNRVQAPKGSFINLAYQMLEPDILDTSKDDQKVNQDMNRPEKQVLHGIGIDETYRPMQYYIKGLQKGISADFMRHFYIRPRPNQVIGVPWLHASLPDLFDYRQLKEDTLTKSRVLADIALWMSSEGTPLFPQNSDEEYVWEPGSTVRTKVKPEVIQADGDLNTALKPLLNRVLLDACCGIGTSYMAVSRDMDGVNFAASRTNLNEDRAGYKTLRKWVDFTICRYLWKQFVFQCVLEGKVSISPDKFLADPYRYTRASFQFPSWDWVDPKADSAALVNMKNAGLYTFKDICAKRGIDWRDYIDQAVQELSYLKAATNDSTPVTTEELMEYLKTSSGVKEDASTQEPDPE
jgi:lambda family phage portal protein